MVEALECNVTNWLGTPFAHAFDNGDVVTPNRGPAEKLQSTGPGELLTPISDDARVIFRAGRVRSR